MDGIVKPTPDRIIDIKHLRVPRMDEKQRGFHSHILNQEDRTFTEHAKALSSMHSAAEELIHTAKKIEELVKDRSYKLNTNTSLSARRIREAIDTIKNNDGLGKILNTKDRQLLYRATEILEERLLYNRRGSEPLEKVTKKMGKFLKALHDKYMLPLRELSLQRSGVLKTNITPRTKETSREVLRSMSIAPQTANSLAA